MTKVRVYFELRNCFSRYFQLISQIINKIFINHERQGNLGAADTIDRNRLLAAVTKDCADAGAAEAREAKVTRHQLRPKIPQK